MEVTFPKRVKTTGYGFFFEVNRIFAAPKHQALELRLGLGIALAYHFFRPFVPVSDFGQNDFEGVVVASVRNNEYQLLIPMELSYKVPLGKSYLRAMLGNQAKIPVRADIHEIFLYENFDPNSPGFEQLINPELADAAREHYSDFFRSYSVRAFTGLSIGFPKFETGIQITTTLISPFGQNQKHGKNLGFRIFVRSFG